MPTMVKMHILRPELLRAIPRLNCQTICTFSPQRSICRASSQLPDDLLLNCQRVELREEYGGAVGGLETAKVIEHNKPADLLAMSKKRGLFFNLIYFQSVSYTKS